MLTHDSMRQRFHAAGAEKEAILSQSAPLRAQEDQIRAQIDVLKAQLAGVVAQRKGVEGPVFALDNERAVLARALGGKTGASA